MPQDPTTIMMILVVIFLSLSVHEYAHAYLADAAGDPTPGIYGRVTMVPWKHWDPIGSILIVMTAFAGFGIGWGKPVPMDPRKMKHPRRDHFWAVAGGPLSNLMIATFAAILLKLLVMVGVGGPLVVQFLVIAVLINVTLFIFNLIPIGPLDGMWILGTFLPEKSRYEWTKFNLTVGQFVFLALVLIPVGGGSIISMILMPLREFIVRLLL